MWKERVRNLLLNCSKRLKSNHWVRFFLNAKIIIEKNKKIKYNKIIKMKEGNEHGINNGIINTVFRNNASVQQWYF